MSLTLYPNAKINLGLLIKGKLPNGYHLLETLMYPLHDLTDTLVIARSEEAGCHLEILGMELEGDPADNLCVRAYEALRREVPDLPGVSASLTKKIPAGAGLGGGSADAAFMLKGLNQLFELGFSDEKLADIAAPLGADVPFFIYNRPLIARGIGNEFEPFDVEFPFRIEWETPEIHSSTVAVYKALDYRECDSQRNLKAILEMNPNKWQELLENDLEKPVFSKYPELKSIKKRFYDRGALYAAMSGSGSTVFGLFPVKD